MSLLDQWLQHPKLQAKARQIGRSRELIELGWMMRTPTSRMALRLVFDAKKKAASDDLPAAKQLYLRALELEPNYFRAHSFLAMIHHRLHEYDEAFSHWDFALAIKAKDIGSNLGKAESFFATDRLSEGTELIDQLLALFPKHAEIFARRALFAERAQNIEASLGFWRSSSQLDPNNPEFALGLARVLIKLDQKLEGKGILDRLKKLRADHLNTQIEVGRGLLSLDYSSEAVEHFEQLLWANPYEIPVLNGLINAVDAKLDVSQLLDWWKRYLNWDKIKSRYISHPARNPAETKSQEKTKLLFVSYKNWNFMQDIVELMDSDQDFEIRTLEFNQEIVTALDYLDADPKNNFTRLQGHAKTFPLDTELLQWADVVFCEWAVHALVWLTRHLPAQTRLVARLHSFEAYGPWPLLVDWSQVNDLIFVADHIREYLDETIKLKDFKQLRLHTIAPAHRVYEFDKEKTSDAQKTLGMMGYNTENKHPLLALEILSALRKQDSAWTLRLLGNSWGEANLSGSALSYCRDFWAYIQDHDLEAHVIFDEWTYDVSEWFRNVGYVISSSHREGTHEAVAQGMSSGAQAVVRKWPLSLKWRGAERRYPNAILFDSPEEASEQILAHEFKFDTSQRSAIIKEAQARFSPSVVVDQIKRVLGASK